MQRQAGFTIIEMMVALIIVLILGGIGFVAYSKFIGQSKETKLLSDLKEYGVAVQSMYADTGALAGLGNTVPFPDALINPNSIQNASVKTKWRGPYIKNPPVCPFDGCQYQLDYTTGQANAVGQIYQYYVKATNVPLENAITLSRAANGDTRVNECITSNISQVVSGAAKSCEVYLSNTSGGAGTKVDVYYTFMTGRY